MELTLLHIEKIYRKRSGFTLNLEDLRGPSQGILLIHGPSGCGKSTLLQGMVGVDPQTEARWTHNGTLVSQYPVEKRRLSMVFQEQNLFPHLTLKTNLELALQRSQQPWDFAAPWVKRFELENYLSQRGDALSGGQRKRGAIVQALLSDPRLVLMDEPLTGLEEDLQEKVMVFIHSWVEKFQKLVILSSHHVDRVRSWSKGEIFWDKGQWRSTF